MIYGDIALISPCQTGSLHPAITKVIHYLSQNDLSHFPVGEKSIFRMTPFFLPLLNPSPNP